MAANYKELYTTYAEMLSVFLEDDTFFNEFVRLIEDSQNQFALTKKQCIKTIETDWLDTIEKYIPSLDKFIRNPRNFIENKEEILPIEISRNITVESIKHLAQHTNLISNIDGDNITPSKILNVYKEESFNTYENRFVNTLLNRLFIFVTKRFDKLTDAMRAEDYLSLTMNQQITVSEDETVAVDFELKTSSKGDSSADPNSNDFARVLKLKKILTEYSASPFTKEMNQYPYIKPPVMRTNAILKNPELKDCLNLWLFIESYDKLGYAIDFIDTSIRPNDRYINELYGLTALNYALFKVHTSAEVEELVLRKVRKRKAIVPKFIKEVYEEFTTEYNITEVEFRKIMEVQRLQLRKKKSAHEKKIVTAIEKALQSEKLYKKEQMQKNSKEKKTTKKSRTVNGV